MYSSLQVPGNSRLRLSLVVGPAIAIVSDFVTVVLQKMAVFDEFVTEMPQATAGSKPTVRPFTVAHDFEDDTAGEASGVLHQLVNGQAIILRSSDNSTVFAAPLITDVALHLDGFSLFCKNLVRPGLNSGNEPPVEEEYLNVQLSNIEVSVSSECHSAEKHVQVDSDRSGLRNDGCKWNFLVALSDLRIDTFKFSLGNEEAADLFRTSVVSCLRFFFCVACFFALAVELYVCNIVFLVVVSSSKVVEFVRASWMNCHQKRAFFCLGWLKLLRF